MERHVILAVVTLLLCRQMCTDGQIFGSEQRGTGSSYIVQDFTPPVQPTEDDYVVRKTVVSDRMRLVFMVSYLTVPALGVDPACRHVEHDVPRLLRYSVIPVFFGRDHKLYLITIN